MSTFILNKMCDFINNEVRTEKVQGGAVEHYFQEDL
jgi:hypothetical protein